MSDDKPQDGDDFEKTTKTGGPSQGSQSSSHPGLQTGVNPAMFVGTTVSGRYEITRLVGQGGMGALFAGQHVEIGRKVAIKVLHKDFRVSEDVFLRFKQEATLAATLTHSNICSVYDFGRLEDGTPYLVMDLLQGRTLAEVLEAEGKLEPRRAVRILAHICEALSHAHAKGVVHRDLKPSNIMLEPDGDLENAKIVDFGIAKSLQTDAPSLTATHETIGSPYYMSPEQCEARKIDHRTDIYSLGCLMYEALTGTTPFKASNALQTMYMHVHSDPEPFSANMPAADINSELEKVILKAMRKKPDDRFQSAEDFKLDAFASVGAMSIDCLLVDPNDPEYKRQFNALTRSVKSVHDKNKPWRDKKVMIPALGAVALLGLGAIGFANQDSISLIMEGRKPGEIYNGDDSKPYKFLELGTVCNPQVHAVYLSQAHDTPRSKDNDESIRGHATVRVTTQTPHVILVLASHAQIEWKVIAEPGTKVEKVLVCSDFNHSKVTGVPQELVQEIKPVSLNLSEGEDLKNNSYFQQLNKEVGEAVASLIPSGVQEGPINTIQYAQQIREFVLEPPKFPDYINLNKKP